MNKQYFRFWILVSIVAISGFSQGMLLPLIAVIFEKGGVSPSLNGLNAIALYIGILLVSPFMEMPLRKYGYKPIIIFGGALVFVSLALFPLWKTFWFWFALRLLIGIGDHSLHFATQTWITSFSSAKKRGRNISLYGLFFGIGFATGPLMTPLVNVNEALPFIISSIVCLAGWLFVFSLKNELPEQVVKINSFLATIKQFRRALKYGWVAFLPPFSYGFLESSLNGSFPIYALRMNIDVSSVSLVLSAFAIGSIITQLPLGILSDQYGRRNILMTVLFLGFFSFTAASFLEHSFIGLFIAFLISGMVVGSTFSLGISYMTDLVPKDLLPTGNLLCGIFFSLGSLSGPIIGGLFIKFLQSVSFFYIISTMLLALSFIIFTFGKKNQVVLEQQN
ncbi:MFS transporter [Neobacillus vireti]|uniref:Major facilitator superfamily protein n=1 Tax=Neobacillus vireti LMG 21834 TaxID=1131730 RepID=A0AB94IK74_9BACI|nr:MFS transporter [Neobacillus vireti]ETI67430.1 major facilitator superfamily protein [Neobacillus vireti LMG 21834]KLT15281.1 MFS transporter [Neobacillus vireti]